MGQVLYRKWRPMNWDQVVGQQHVIRTLRNAVAREHLAHAYLFAGPRGTGKTTTARILAKAANCLAQDPAERPDDSCEHCLAVNEGRYLDLIEIDAASNTSVDDVRDLRDRINFAPSSGRFKVYIVDEVHMLSTAAFNALLKTLEEPPPHAIFVLATTEVHKIPATVLSRCQRHEFRRLPVAAMTEYLSDMVQQEQFAVEPQALELIARQATGSLRDAVSLLDQLVSIGEQVTLEQAREVLGLAGNAAVGELVTALAHGQIGDGLSLINGAMDGGADARQLARQVVGYLRGVLLSQLGEADLPELDPEQRSQMAALAKTMDRELLLRAMRAFSQASHARSGNWLPGLQLELALLEAAGAQANRGTAPASASAAQPASGSSPAELADDANPGSPSVEVADEAKQASTPVEVADEAKPAGSPAASDDAGPGAEATDAAPERRASGPGQATAEFQQVLDGWSELLAAAYRRNPRAQALLNSCKPLGIEDQALVLGFQSDLLRDKMEQGRNLETVQQSLREVFDSPLQLRCVLLKEWERDSEGVASPPPMQEGGMVATALRDLGAQVVDYREEEE